MEIKIELSKPFIKALEEYMTSNGLNDLNEAATSCVEDFLIERYDIDLETIKNI